MARKVLLASMNVGGGHAALRDSFHLALTKSDPGARRLLPVVWDSGDQSINRFYSFVVHRSPRFQGMLFDLSERDWIPRVMGLSNPSLLREVSAVLEEKRPDLVLSTHFVLSMMFARARRHLRFPVPLIAAIPDYGVPTRGFFPPQPGLRADRLVVMDASTRDHYLTSRSLPPSRVHLSGFMVREPFSRLGQRMGSAGKLEEQGRRDILDSLIRTHPTLARIRLGRPSVLFLGGSAWTEKARPVLQQLIAREQLAARLNLIIVCGKDRVFYRRLFKEWSSHASVSVLEYVSPQTMASLMAIADLPVLGSLAPATMQELLELRCGPLLLFHFIPGTESPHVAYIERHSIGIYEPDPTRMVSLLAQAVGFEVPQPLIMRLLHTFPLQASRIRAENRERALHLGRFLELAFGDRRAQPASEPKGTDMEEHRVAS